MYVILEKRFTFRCKWEWCYVNTYQNARQAREKAAELKKAYSKIPLKIITYHEWKVMVKKEQEMREWLERR